jgi:redox-sensitive bicupin YhaK (pirin superfamily)
VDEVAPDDREGGETMSRMEATEPRCTLHEDEVAMVIQPRSRDLGGFTVRRVLPSPKCRAVGPFVFFDEMGPADFAPGQGIEVRPHPHIGLATVTFLFAGQILHRDSLGFVQAIEPGAVNLMTAGRGIVHSERTDPALRRVGQFLHGIQTWMALPEDRQEIDPDFVHYPAERLPKHTRSGVTTTLIVGEAHGLRSPVAVHAATLYLEHRMEAGSQVPLPHHVAERAVYVVAGEVTLGTGTFSEGMMVVLRAGGIELRARSDSHVMVIGGDPIGARHIWWNFVHSSPERIEQAKRDWSAGAFAKVPGDDEFIPLPKD